MGCDIHSIAQIRQANGRWRTIAKRLAGDERDYETFGVYGGPRNWAEWHPIAEPRGFPDEPDGWCEEDTGGDHTFSWLSLRELEEKWRLLARQTPPLAVAGIHAPGTTCHQMLPLMRQHVGLLCAIRDFYGLTSDDVRLVFGFDS